MGPRPQSNQEKLIVVNLKCIKLIDKVGRGLRFGWFEFTKIYDRYYLYRKIPKKLLSLLLSISFDNFK